MYTLSFLEIQITDGSLLLQSFEEAKGYSEYNR